MKDESTARTILVIDDNTTNLRVACEHLRAGGYEVLTARNGESGIERAQLARPDLILLDVQMPGIDGFETCRRLKESPATRDIPVIFTTVLTTVDDKVQGFNAGGVDYIPKPFQVEELLARVGAHLTLYRLQRKLRAEIQERQLAEAALRKANLELERLAVLDGLTMIANRRRFDQYLVQQWEQPEAAPLGLLLCDVDHFKAYNDAYGHQAGDHCLQRVARSISRSVYYDRDLVARYGGEEFAVLLPATDLAGAVRVAEIIRAAVRALAIPHAYSSTGPCVTASIGVASALPTGEREAGALVAMADAALYEAKRLGRDRIAQA